MQSDQPSAQPVGRGARYGPPSMPPRSPSCVDKGYAALSVENVAQRAGVHKTTVYRRWKDRESLLIDALAEHMAMDIPDSRHRSDRDRLAGAGTLHRRRRSPARTGRPSSPPCSPEPPSFRRSPRPGGRCSTTGSPGPKPWSPVPSSAANFPADTDPVRADQDPGRADLPAPAHHRRSSRRDHRRPGGAGHAGRRARRRPAYGVRRRTGQRVNEMCRRRQHLVRVTASDSPLACVT